MCVWTAEIRKVFSICDKDGDGGIPPRRGSRVAEEGRGSVGTISAKELKTVMKELAGTDPTDQELESVS